MDDDKLRPPVVRAQRGRAKVFRRHKEEETTPSWSTERGGPRKALWRRGETEQVVLQRAICRQREQGSEWKRLGRALRISRFGWDGLHGRIIVGERLEQWGGGRL